MHRSLRASRLSSVIARWSLMLAVLLVAPIVRAQTAVPPSAGDGLTIASAYQIKDLGNLVWVGQHYTSGTHYLLMNDIDASVTATWNDVGTNTDVLEGFLPIATETSPFQGIFDGNGHRIIGLTINRGDPLGNVGPGGLFGCVGAGGVIRSLILEGGSVLGTSDIGALAACNEGTIEGCSASVPVKGVDWVLIIWNIASNAGGLVGRNHGGVIRNSYATGAVSGGSYAGGLVGDNDSGTVTDSYASGSVTGRNAGGLVWANASGLVMGTITDCYATGRVVGSDGVGGLVVENQDESEITSCYWDAESTSAVASAGGTSETTALMQQQSTYVGWDFVNVWAIAPDVNQGYPTLRGAAPPITRPNKPLAPSPADGATSQALAMTLRWQDGGGATSYDVYFGTENPPVARVAAAQVAAFFAVPSLLNRGATYFWRIDATNAGGTTTGDVWRFTTASPPPSRRGLPTWLLW